MPRPKAFWEALQAMRQTDRQLSTGGVQFARLQTWTCHPRPHQKTNLVSIGDLVQASIGMTSLACRKRNVKLLIME